MSHSLIYDEVWWSFRNFFSLQGTGWGLEFTTSVLFCNPYRSKVINFPDMAKVITQETYDAVVKENMQEFEMSAEEAVSDAVEQFQSQVSGGCIL